MKRLKSLMYTLLVRPIKVKLPDRWQYETWNGLIRFPTLRGLYYPDAHGFYDPKQQITIAKKIIQMCEEVISKENK